jgi:hypothetical protein
MTDTTKETNSIFNWTDAASAIHDYANFKVVLSNNQMAGDYGYLVQGTLAVLAYNPAILADHVFLDGDFDPAWEYPKKAAWKSEESEHKKDVAVIALARNLHKKKCGLAISSLESMFEISSNARKLLAAERTRLESTIVPTELHSIYVALLAVLKIRFAPNKPTDGSYWINKLTKLDFADGRGFASNASDFAEAMASLSDMSLTPDRLVAQKYLSDALAKLPLLAMHLITLSVQNAADAHPGAAVPDIPRWQSCLTACEDTMRSFPDWDVKAPSNSSAVKSNQSYAATTYCPKCGRNNHTIDCTFRYCICGKDTKADPSHRACDKAHDKLRGEFNARFSGSRGGGSSDSRGGRSGGRGGRSERGRGGRGGRGGRSGRGGRGDNQLTIKDGKRSSKQGKDDSLTPIGETINKIDDSVTLMARVCEINTQLTQRLLTQLDSGDDEDKSTALVTKRSRKN